jgi:NAD/NADP transhydrogenase beta subunit
VHARAYLPLLSFRWLGPPSSIKRRAQEVGTHQEIDVASAAEALTSASKVIIVPGYGMAVANAQYPVAELAKHLNEKEIQVRQKCGSAIPKVGDRDTIKEIVDTCTSAAYMHSSGIN